MTEDDQDYCLSKEDVEIFLGTFTDLNPKCLLMLAKNESGEVITFHSAEQMFYCGQNALELEEQALKLLEREIKQQRIKEVMFIMNIWPCNSPKYDIIDFCDKNKDQIVSFKVYFVRLIGNPFIYHTGEQIKVHKIYGGYWPSLIRAKNPSTDFGPFWQEQPEVISDWDHTMTKVITERGMSDHYANREFLADRRNFDDENSKKMRKLGINTLTTGTTEDLSEYVEEVKMASNMEELSLEQNGAAVGPNGAEGGQDVEEGSKDVAEGDECYLLSKEDVGTFLTTKPNGYNWPSTTCLLMLAKNEAGDLITFNAAEQMFYDTGLHVEKQALMKLDTTLRDRKIKVLFIMNYSPCSDCKDAIIQFCQDNHDQIISFNIYYAGVYKYGMGPLKELRIKKPQIKIQNIHGSSWKSLILAKDPSDLALFWDDCVESLTEALTTRGLAEYKVMKRNGEEVSILSEDFLTAREKCDECMK